MTAAAPVEKRVDTLRRAATALRDQFNLLIPDHARDHDFIDYPTGWAIQKAGIGHLDQRCSAVQTNGAMLCDCGAIQQRWRELRVLRDVAEILEHEAAVDEQYGATASTLAVILAKRYLEDLS